MKSKRLPSISIILTGISVSCFLLLASCVVPKEVKMYGAQIGKMGVQSSRVLEDGRLDVARNSAGTPTDKENKYLKDISEGYLGLRTDALRLIDDIKTPLEDGTKIEPATLEEWKNNVASLKTRQKKYLDTAADGPYGRTLGAAEEIAEITLDATAVIGLLEKIVDGIANYSEKQKNKSIEFLDVQKNKWPAATAIGTSNP